VRADVKANPPPSCSQQSVTIPPETGGKYRQSLLFGSSEWQSTYATLRNTNEGFNGYVKTRPTRPWTTPGADASTAWPARAS
jgi:hypothetical protein